MKTRIICYGLWVIGAMMPLGAFAQMNNVIEVENDYKPTVKDADKISSLPQVQETAVKHYNVQFSNTARPTTNYSSTPMDLITSDPTLLEQYGFITGAYGLNSSTFVRAASRFGLTQYDFLSADIVFDGFNTDVDHYLYNDDWKSRFFQLKPQLSFEHRFKNNGALIVSADMTSQVFNYQTIGQQPSADWTDKQHNTGTNIGVQLTPFCIGDHFAISLDAGLSWFRQKYATNRNEGLKENTIRMAVTPSYRFNEQHSADVTVKWTNSGYNDSDIHSNGYFDIMPHYRFSNQQMDLTLGAYISMSNGKFNVAPDAILTYHADKTTDIYVSAQAGNSFQPMGYLCGMSPYFALPIFYNAAPEWHKYNAKAGVRFSPIDALNIDIHGGYDQSDNRAEILPQPLHDYADLSAAPSNYYNVIPLITQVNGNHAHAGIDVSYRLKNTLSLELKNTWNHWGTTDDFDNVNITWRPILDLDWKANVNILSNLKLGVGCRLQTFNKENGYYERDNTFDLGADLTYTFFKGLSVYIQGENLLNQSFDRYQFYRSPGITARLGVAYSF